MSLKHALLGFINYGPMTGYELKKFFDASVAHFWNSELSHIYPALKAMEADGLVAMSIDVQQDRPNRKVYSITDVGREELRRWLATPVQPEQVREPLLVKVFFGRALGKQPLLVLLQGEAERLRRRVEFEMSAFAYVGKFAEAIGLEREAPFWRSTVDAGTALYDATLAWLDDTIDKIAKLPDHYFEGPPGSRKSRMDAQKVMTILESLSSTHIEQTPATGS
jgi:PadR family transcriptional regulator AphA